MFAELQAEISRNSAGGRAHHPGDARTRRLHSHVRPRPPALAADFIELETENLADALALILGR